MELYDDIRKRYEENCSKRLSINMERGWPSKEQLELSMPMLGMVTENTDLCREDDYRGYGGTAGIAPMKELFAQMLHTKAENIYIGGTMSTSIMYDIVNKAWLFGLKGHEPWGKQEKVKFICPSPGYEKHFKICTTFGIEMIPVPMNENGPDMEKVTELAAADKAIKGMWCVPLYSNPTGAVYSDEVVRMLASMETASEDFTLFWDNAYCVHHITEDQPEILDIISECELAGRPDRVFEFASTSKITFPGGGVACCASSIENIEWLTKNSLLQLKTGDKINQYRHVLFLKDLAGVQKHMKKHGELIAEKFKAVDEVMKSELAGYGVTGLAEWKIPGGGYFIHVKLLPGMAKRVYGLCRDCGVNITPAGSTFPYGVDPEDRYIRLAPTYLTVEELRMAMEVFCISIKLAYQESIR